MEGGGGSSLEETAAFAAAMVCFVLVFVSIVIEHILHLIAKWLKNRNRIKLYEALLKIKSELMLVGFISLLLTAGQSWIVKICINKEVAKSWLPCKKGDIQANHTTVCKEGEVPFISLEALHELHVFIFILACAHVINCVLTMVLGKAKMKKWRKWEEETKTEEYMSSHNSRTPRYSRQTTFVRRHSNSWTTNPILLPMTGFIEQFFPSVRKVDYLTLRNGFIMTHVAPENQANFDFHNYMDRTLEEDFKFVVGISPLIWFAAVISLLFAKYQFHHALWLPVVPVIVLLVAGTKLQVIIAKMAFRIQETSDIVQGAPVVRLGDDLFWFNSPRFLLYLLNFVLFQNAIQVAFYQYTWLKFGNKSCFHREKEDKIIILCMGLLVLILCSYVTLPLYALVTLMGSTVKRTVARHTSDDNQVELSVKEDTEHLDTYVAHGHQAARSTPSPSSHGQALLDENINHTIDIMEVALLQIPPTKAIKSKDAFAYKRSMSCR